MELQEGEVYKYLGKLMRVDGIDSDYISLKSCKVNVDMQVGKQEFLAKVS